MGIAVPILGANVNSAGTGRQVVGIYIDLTRGRGFAGCEFLLVSVDRDGYVRVAGEVDGIRIEDQLIDGTEVNMDIIRGIAERIRSLRVA